MIWATWMGTPLSKNSPSVTTSTRTPSISAVPGRAQQGQGLARFAEHGRVVPGAMPIPPPLLSTMAERLIRPFLKERTTPMNTAMPISSTTAAMSSRPWITSPRAADDAQNQQHHAQHAGYAHAGG